MKAFSLITLDRLMTATTLTGSLLFLQLTAMVSPGLAQDNVSYQADDLSLIESSEPDVADPVESEGFEGQQSADQASELGVQNPSINLPQFNSDEDPDTCAIAGVLVAVCTTF